MLHVSDERLAALADEEPTAPESAHLASCAACAREREAHRAILSLAASERVRLTPPLTSWDAIADGLAVEAAVASSARTTGRPRLPVGASRTAMRIAAAVLLMVVGMAAGRYSAGVPVLALGGVAGPPVWERGAASASEAEFGSEGEAIAAMARAELQYQRAVAFLGANHPSLELEEKDAIRTRLAALDEVAVTTQRALNEVPYDPVINSYYLNTLGAREVTLRQMEQSMPPGVRLTRF